MRKWGVLAVASSMVLAGCGGDDESVEDALRSPVGIYFHNQVTDQSASTPQSTTVDLVIRGDKSDPLFEGRAYSTDEQDGMAFKLDADRESVRFDVFTTTNTLVDNQSFNLSSGGKYTLVLMGEVAGNDDLAPILRLYRQSLADVSPDKVRIRLINALSGKSGSPMIVTDTKDPLADGFMYGAHRDFQEATPESDSKLTLTIVEYSLNITHTASCAIEAGKSYDVILAHPAYDSEAVDIFCQQLHGS